MCFKILFLGTLNAYITLEKIQIQHLLSCVFYWPTMRTWGVCSQQGFLDFCVCFLLFLSLRDNRKLKNIINILMKQLMVF